MDTIDNETAIVAAPNVTIKERNHNISHDLILHAKLNIPLCIQITEVQNRGTTHDHIVSFLSLRSDECTESVGRNNEKTMFHLSTDDLEMPSPVSVADANLLS